jgi:hypothetical protein
MLEFLGYLYGTVAVIIMIAAMVTNQEDINNGYLPRYSTNQILWMSIFWLPGILVKR